MNGGKCGGTGMSLKLFISLLVLITVLRYTELCTQEPTRLRYGQARRYME